MFDGVSFLFQIVLAISVVINLVTIPISIKFYISKHSTKNTINSGDNSDNIIASDNSKVNIKR